MNNDTADFVGRLVVPQQVLKLRHFPYYEWTAMKCTLAAELTPVLTSMAGTREALIRHRQDKSFVMVIRTNLRHLILFLIMVWS